MIIRIEKENQSMKTLCFLVMILAASDVFAGNPGAVRPDPKLTPGVTLDVSTETLCKPGYPATVRNVPESEKVAVYKEYGITPYKGIGKDYEVDHLISLELGGSNDIRNLWLEPYRPVPGAHQKDLVENWLHRQVCQGKISLKEAQREISTDWMDVYEKNLSAVHGGKK